MLDSNTALKHTGRSSVEDNAGAEEEIVEPDQGNGELPRAERWAWTLTCTVLSHIISQLRPGADLSRVVLPTFILEPRSMLERITKYVPAAASSRDS